MPQQSRPAIFLGLGVVLALLAGLLVFTVTREATAAPPNPLADTTPLVVARVDIPERTVVTPDMLETRNYPKTLVPAAAITEIAQAARQTTLVKIPAGTPIVAGQLVVGGGATGLSLTLEKGKVYVAFPAADPLTASGAIKPGDRVDILATVPGERVAQGAPAAPSPSPGASPAPALGGAVTQTILQNLEVQDVIGRGVLTFIVDHQTSLVLKNLRDSGVVVDLVIRSRAETDAVRTAPVDNGYFIRTYIIR